MDASSPEQSSWLVQFILAALAAVGITLASFFKGLRSPEHPGRRVIEAAEITDTAALSRRIIDDLTPSIKFIMESARERDRKIEQILDKLTHLENEQEIAKRAREEVARQLSSERDWDKRRGPAE